MFKAVADLLFDVAIQKISSARTVLEISKDSAIALAVVVNADCDAA